MSRKNNESLNTIKYSIWDTKTDKSHTTSLEDSPVLNNNNSTKKKTEVTDNLHSYL